MGNTRIKAAVLRRISSAAFCFYERRASKNIENILKNKILLIWLLRRLEMSKTV
jgi:hypothetical protein